MAGSLRVNGQRPVGQRDPPSEVEVTLEGGVERARAWQLLAGDRKLVILVGDDEFAPLVLQ